MKKNDYVRNEEELYRSVRGKLEEEYSYGPKGNLQISSEAFRDRDRKPSVDRAELRKFNPALSKLSDIDGVVSLMTAEVRAIGKVQKSRMKMPLMLSTTPLQKIPPTHKL